MVHTDDRFRVVRLRLLSVARLDPGACDRAVADRARGRGLAAFLLLLSRAGDRAFGLRLWLRARGRVANAARRRRDGDYGWIRVLTIVTPSTYNRDHLNFSLSLSEEPRFSCPLILNRFDKINAICKGSIDPCPGNCQARQQFPI